MTQRSIKDFWKKDSQNKNCDSSSSPPSKKTCPAISSTSTASGNPDITVKEFSQQLPRSLAEEPLDREIEPSFTNTRHSQHGKIPAIPKLLSKNHPSKRFVFPKQTSGLSRNRSVQHSWFERFDWLHYNEENDSLFCFICIKACNMVGKSDSWYSDVELAFLTVGFKNWKDANAKFVAHQNSVFHKKCADLIIKRKSAISIDAQLQNALLKAQNDSKKCLLAIISSLRFLARSGIAIRGHESDEGNLKDLLKERAHDIPELNPWLNKRDNYLSADIQNEILQIMAHSVLRGIVNEIKLSPFFSVIADGTTDISGMEQFSLCIRFVHPKLFTIHEKFIGMYNPENSKGCTLAAAIEDVLLRLNLPLSDLCGHCFDGARCMSGHFKGVQKLLKDKRPKSIYVHCSNHSADLALQEVTKTRTGMCDLLCLVKDCSNIILESSKRRKIFENIILPPCKNDSENDNSCSPKNLVSLCPTRWCARHKSLLRFKSEYSRVEQTLQQIIDEKGTISSERESSIRGWIKKFRKFETLFFLNVSIEIFGPCEILARALQSPEMTATGALQSAKLLIQEFSVMRSESSFNRIYDKTKNEAETLALNSPAKPRKKKVPKRLEYKDKAAESVDFEPRMFLRQEFFEILDLLVNELKSRFDQEGFHVLVRLEEILLKAGRGEVPESHILQQKLGLFADDFDIDILKTQLQFVKKLSKEKFTTCSSLAAQLSAESDTVKNMLDQVIKLVELVMTIPASSASAERSFSALRRLKNYLRNTMTQNRLNHIMILNVHKKSTEELDLQNIMREFISRTEERKKVFGNV